MYVLKQLPTFRASLFAPYWQSDSVSTAYAVEFFTVYILKMKAFSCSETLVILPIDAKIYTKRLDPSSCSGHFLWKLSHKTNRECKISQSNGIYLPYLVNNKAVCFGGSFFPRPSALLMRPNWVGTNFVFSLATGTNPVQKCSLLFVTRHDGPGP
jgi:hypothetical protein